MVCERSAEVGITEPRGTADHQEAVPVADLDRWATLARRALRAGAAYVQLAGEPAPEVDGAVLSVVLRDGDDELGTVWVADGAHRAWSGEDRAILDDLAAALTCDLALQGTVEHTERTATVVEAHNRIHELIAVGAPLPAVLAEVIASMERYDRRLLGTMLLLDDNGETVTPIPAPTLPASFTEAFTGARIGPAVGSCGTAAYHNIEVVTEDIETDERWAPFRELTRAHGLRHCWSFPIRGAEGDVLGTFGVYGTEPRLPSPEHCGFLRDAAHLAGIAIEHHRVLEALRHRATHDVLTDLPDTSQLDARLSAALDRARRTGLPVSVLFIDVDRLRLINDHFGHQAGDEVLQHIAARLAAVLRPDDLVARIGGDEFVVVAEGLSHAEAAALADRIVAAVGVPVRRGAAAGHTATVSVGLAVVHGGEADTREAIRRADDAMYVAKADGGNRHRRGAHSAPGAPGYRLRVENALRGALDRGELRIVGQPLFDLAGGLHGVEALLRWSSPELGVVGPDEFIPVAEESGMMDRLGAWVLEEACRQHATLPGEALLTVNVSPRQLRAATLPEAIATALDRAGLAPERLVLEITETALLGSDAATHRALATVRRMGVGVLLDDFGTGFSSLSMIKDHPIDGLKIDRSFIAGLPGDVSSAAIVGAVVEMAHALGRRVVAEGIETDDQLEHVRSVGCDLVQGYLLGRPAPFADLRAALQAAVARPAA
jgi:diguanylate cyclase (GGDEF)-like protein